MLDADEAALLINAIERLDMKIGLTESELRLLDGLQRAAKVAFGC